MTKSKKKIFDTMFFESQINNFNFRYEGGSYIEVSRVGDRNRTVLREIPVGELTSEKQFHQEISFWFMEYGNTIDE